MIRGKRVGLKSVERESLDTLRSWRNDPTLRRHFREHREISRDMQNAWYEKLVLGNPNQVDFEIHDMADPPKGPPSESHDLLPVASGLSTLIGHCGLYYVNWIARHAELSIYIGSRHHRGRGYGKEALTLLMDYAFDVMNLNRVWCEVFDHNDAIHVYKKIGFVPEGVRRAHHYDEGRYIDCHILGLMRDEWIKRRPSTPVNSLTFRPENRTSRSPKSRRGVSVRGDTISST